MSDDSYLAYFEGTKDAAQHRIWTFYEAVRIVSIIHLYYYRILCETSIIFVSCDSRQIRDAQDKS